MRLAPSAEEVQARLGDAWPISGAVDCHAHVFERGFPLAAVRAFDPLPYPLEYYLAWKLARGGFVGARLMTSRIGSLGLEVFEEVAKRCLPHRWHVEINVDACEEWVALEPRL